MFAWQIWSAAVSAGVAVLGYRLVKKQARCRKRALLQQLATENLLQRGFVCSRRYQIGTALLLIDETAMQWAVVDQPFAGVRARPFSAIAACRCVRQSKRHVGVRRVNAAGMLRSSLGAANREIYETETVCQLEITLHPPEENTRIVINCTDTALSPEWVQTILTTLQERTEG